MNWSRISLAVGSAFGVFVFAVLLTSPVVAHGVGFSVDCGTVVAKRDPTRASSSTSTNAATIDQALRQGCNDARKDQAVHAGAAGVGLILVAVVGAAVMPDDRRRQLQIGRLPPSTSRP